MGGNMGDIYAIKRLDIDRIVYIGQTIRSYKNRWQQHKQVAKNADSSRYALYAAIQKLGIDNFYPLLIENCDNSLLNEREQYWIKYYKTKVECGGYNLTDGGDANSERQRKHIYQYSLDGKYIDEFDSIADAAWELGVTDSGISKAANNQLNQSHGYRWSFIKKDCLENNYKSNSKEIKQFSKDGVYIRTFPSARQAAIEIANNPKGVSNISAVARGERQTAYGFKWSY